MPGIAAIITRMPREEAELQLDRMISTLRHESFYTTGKWIDEECGVYVAWVARKGSFCDGMPVCNERGDLVLVFSGEEFPAPEATSKLRSLGHNFDAKDASYLVHMAEEDPLFPAGLNGRFHGILVDRTHGSVLVFNDRYSMHRLHYHESPDATYFSAEPKAILRVRPELRTIDSQSLADFIACDTVLENRTFFPHIHVLSPASTWKFRDGSLDTKGCYFKPNEWEDQEALEYEDYYRELRDTFTEILPRYFGGTEPIGMSLTGGLDTRILLACRKAPAGSLPCYTFGSMYRENHDVRVARRVAKYCNQSHVVLVPGHEFLQKFEHYAERAVYLTDGGVGVERAPDLFLNEMAREIAPIRMSGVYGGEVLRAVRAFKPVEPKPNLFSGDLWSFFRQAQETYKRVANTHPVSFTAFKQNPWFLHGVLQLEQTQVGMRSPYLDNQFIRTVFRSPMSAFGNNETSLRLIADGDPALLEIPTDRGLGGSGGRLLRAVSRRLLECSFKAEYASDMGMPQWLAGLDRLSPLRLEKMFLGRHKVSHFRVWYRDNLAAYVREMLLDPLSLSRPYIDPKALRRIVEGHIKGRRNHTNEIHTLLTLEILHRHFIDGSGVLVRTDIQPSNRLLTNAQYR